MATSISVDFVRHCESFVGGDGPDEGQPWRCPSLQVMDIQLYGGCNHTPPNASIRKGSAADQATRRYYVAMHDTKGLVWAISPPGSSFDGLIVEGSVEVGSLVTLEEYAIVEAANGRRVLVVMAASCKEAMPLSLMGNPFVSPTLFRLSPSSLLAKKEAMDADDAKGRRSRGHADSQATQSLQSQAVALRTMIPLEALWTHYADLTTFERIHTWHVRVRVLWKSKLRRIVGAGGPADAAAMPTQGHSEGQRGGGGKYVFDAILCDEAGDAVKGVFLGKRLFEAVRAGSCYRIGGGSVHLQNRPVPKEGADGKRQRYPYGDQRADEDDPPTELVAAFVQFHEHTWVECADEDEGADAASPLPAQPHRLLSGAEDDFIEVRTVVNKASLGDLVSFRGIISKCGSVTDVQTKHGKVDKITLTVKDRSAADSLEVTLWGQTAHNLAAQLPVRLGTTWCFRDMTVRMFGNMKTISSRSSSEVQPMSAYSHFTLSTLAPGHRSRQPNEEISMTFAGTQFPQNRTEAVATPVESSHQTADTASTPTKFPFMVAINDLSERRPTVPYLLRIQHIDSPFVASACRHCGRFGGCDTVGPYRCSHCGRLSPDGPDTRFMITLYLSDGLDVLGATAFGEAAEALCGEPISSYLQNCLAIGAGAYTNGLVNSLIGLPVLVKVTKLGAEYHITMLQHVDLDSCTAVLSEMARDLLDF